MGDSIKFLFEKSSNYFDTVANGIDGGLTPNKMFKIYFTEDVYPLAKSQEYERDKNGFRLVNEDIFDGFVKVIKGSVTISPNDMPHIISMLQSMYNAYNHSKGGNNNG